MRVALILQLTAASVASSPLEVEADDWISADGIVAVSAPVAGTFELVVPTIDPFIALWTNSDESVRMGILRIELPEDRPLYRASFEQGFANEIGGSITSTSTLNKGGHDVWVIAATGSAQGHRFRAWQAVLHSGKMVYKVMATSLGETDVHAQAIKEFIHSTRPGPNATSTTESNYSVPSVPVGRPGTIPIRQPANTHEYSVLAAEFGFMLLIGIAVWRVVKRKGRNE